MTKEPNPSKRGSNEDLKLTGVSPMTAPTEAVWAITKVVSFKAGFLKVEMSNGKTYERKGGTISWRNNNPGNIKWGLFAKANHAIDKGHGNHAVFPTYELGLNAQKKLLFGPEKTYHKLSILEAMRIYAPVSDPNFKNEPDKYANFIEKETGISKNTILNTLSDEQQTKMLKAMHQYEGWKEGTVNIINEET